MSEGPNARTGPIKILDRRSYSLSSVLPLLYETERRSAYTSHHHKIQTTAVCRCMYERGLNSYKGPMYNSCGENSLTVTYKTSPVDFRVILSVKGLVVYIMS